MTSKGEIRPFFSSEVSTFLHSELGEAIKRTAITRETYLGVAFVYGLRNVEYLLENLQGIEVGDRVTLYRKYNSEPPTCTGLTPWAIPDDGSSIRVITLKGGVLGYIQPRARFIMAELMKAGKHLYARINSIDTTEPINTRKVITLKVYWVEESQPLQMTNTYEIGEAKYEAMVPNDNAIFLDAGHPEPEYRALEGIHEIISGLKKGDRLRLIRKPSELNPTCIQIWTYDRKNYLGNMKDQSNGMIANIMDAGKNVYGVVTSASVGVSENIHQYYFSVYVED